MPSIFSFTSPTPKKGRHAKPLPRSVSGPLTPQQRASRPTSRTPSGIGEFGDLPASSSPSKVTANRNSHPLTPPYSPDDSHTLDLPPILPPKYTFAPTWLPPAHTDLTSNGEDDELGSRSYGFLGGVGAKVTLSVEEVGKVLKDVGDELMRRGLTIPMLFSNQALELNQVRTKHVIQTYLGTLSQPSKDRSESFKRDILYAKEHELAWFLRWALSRLARIREGTREVLRGIIEWDVYEEWRGREKSANYRSDAYPHLSALVPSKIYQLLLTPLLHLLSRFAAHSHLSGLTPHALASLFAPFIFNVAVSAPAMLAHSQYVRAASATEHLLLAYIRSSGRRDGLGIADLPTRLAAWVKGYPAMIARDEELARGGPRRGAKIVRCERASRIVRAYSRDLIVTAELWAQDIASGNGGQQWDAWDRVIIRDKKGEAGRPKFSSSWKRKMSVKETLPLPSSSSSGLERTSTYGRAEKPGTQMREKEGRKRRDDTRGDEDAARWGSVAGKEWSMFEEGGFDTPELRGSVDLQGRLKFDLTESAKLTISERRQTMDWTEFASPSGGFNRTDPQLATSLGFADPISESITHWPETREDIRKRLHKSQKEAVPFNYDTSVNIGTGIHDTDGTSVVGFGVDDKGRVYVEEAFVDFWADLVVGAGWGDREELTFKESNWALIEYKAKPSRQDGSTSTHPLSDPRTSSLYFLFEERVPLEYQLAIANPHQKKTFGSLFSPRRKRTPTKQTNEALRQTLGTGWQDNEFDRMLLHRTQTKRITLNKSDQPTVWHWTPDQQNSPTRIVKRESPPTQDESGMSDGKANFFSKGKQRNHSSRRNKVVDEGVKQREQQLEYEIASASGVSSGGDSPNSGNGNANGKKNKEEKWMDILIANGAKKKERRGTAAPPIGLPLSPRPSPPHSNPSPNPNPTPQPDLSAQPNLSPQTSSSPHPNIFPPPNPSTHPNLTPRLPSPPPAKPAPPTSTSEPPVDIPTPRAVAFHLERPLPPPLPPSYHDYASIHSPGSTAGLQLEEYDSMHETTLDSIDPYASPPSTHRYPSVEQDQGTVSVSVSPPPALPAPTADPDILSPKPQRDIHNLVDSYYENTASSDTNQVRIHGPSRDSTFSTISTDYPQSEEADEEGDEGELQPPEIGWKFDMTPGREPSPARYKHGEPLQNGESLATSTKKTWNRHLGDGDMNHVQDWNVDVHQSATADAGIVGEVPEEEN